MPVEVTKDAIDIGIVVRDAEAALKFYRDTLGFRDIGPMPRGPEANSTMHRLVCGKALVKLIEMDTPPSAANPGGDTRSATGYRYTTISITNLDAVFADCEAGGYPVTSPPHVMGNGARVAMLQDPDGNFVELYEPPKRD